MKTGLVQSIFCCPQVVIQSDDNGESEEEVGFDLAFSLMKNCGGWPLGKSRNVVCGQRRF